MAMALEGAHELAHIGTLAVGAARLGSPHLDGAVVRAGEEEALTSPAEGRDRVGVSAYGDERASCTCLP